MNLLLAGVIKTFKPLADKTVSVTLHTQEIDAEQGKMLWELVNNYVKIHITDSGITEKKMKLLNDTKIEIDELVNGKTKAQRIRNILYLHWEREKPTSNFDDFYNIEMEKIIELLKQTYL